MSKTKSERKSIAEQFDARNLNAKMVLRVENIEKCLGTFVAALEETRAMVGILVSAIDAMKVKGLITDAEIKEELKKFVADANQKNSAGLGPDPKSNESVRETDDGLSTNEPTVSTTESDRESDSNDG